MSSYGIKETKEIVKFGIAFGEGLATSLADGKFDLSDAVNFYPAVLASGDAFEGAKLVPKELGDLDAEERAEIVSYVESEFDIENDKIEMAIERALKLVMYLYESVEFFKSLKEKEA